MKVHPVTNSVKLGRLAGSTGLLALGAAMFIAGPAHAQAAPERL